MVANRAPDRVPSAIERTPVRQRMPAKRCDGHFLAADIGGTHARLALVARTAVQSPTLAAYRVYPCADHPHLEDILRSFCAEVGMQPRELVLACAGYVHAGSVINKNLAWPVLPHVLKERLQLDHVWVLNDLQALAYAIGQGAANDAVVLKASAAQATQSAPVVVVGPGTGLGAAVWLPGKPPRVIATEAGHTQLSARIGREQQVLAQLAPPDTHVSHEMLLSGPGLHRIYTALCAIHDRYPSLHEPQAVSAAAMAGRDAIAHEALTLLCGWLGSFAADLAMLYGATGGICLAGGFLFQIADFLRSSSLLDRFLDKGVMRPFLQNVPIRVMDHGHHGVLGAAGWHIDTHNDARAEEVRNRCIEVNDAVLHPG
ncbi:MAG TPA: glucokinase [Dyella sp.]|uniref:glucokinase n=1 Tax=Dyella sp. TaxID=1869338 RepID=UPI002CC35022|nr:glucokinase [Dyella sp.]HUB89605.1 glucokinase [Dyella sp.]